MRHTMNLGLCTAALLLPTAPAALAAQGVGTGQAPFGTSNGNSANGNPRSSTSGTGGGTATRR